MAAAHLRTVVAGVAGLAVYVACLERGAGRLRLIYAWDAFGLVFLILMAVLMIQATPAQMPANARAQEEGEWTIFSMVMLATTMSFAAIVGELPGTKDLDLTTRRLHVTLVVATLALSWLLTQVVFALRYAHEYYTMGDGVVPDGGLQFPSTATPDYWDFIYFAVVLGMTFQVSDVQITSQKLRRLATAHGVLSFVFNTVIVALSVNLAANLL